MSKDLFVLSINTDEIKVRKKFAPKVKVVKSKKAYDRKREKKRAMAEEPSPFPFMGLDIYLMPVPLHIPLCLPCNV